MKFLKKSLSEGIDFNSLDFVTHIIIPIESIDVDSDDIAIKKDIKEICSNYNNITVIQADIRSSIDHTKHDGDKLKKCLLKIIES